MRLWRHSSRDSVPLCMSIVQLAATLWSAWVWPQASVGLRVGIVVMLALSMLYSILIVAHLFTHVPWFRSARLNAAASLLTSLNIGQSTQVYRLKHVRNHHRFNNDRQGPNGKTRDTSSTFSGTKDGDHEGLMRYAVGGAAATLAAEARSRLALMRLWRVAAHEQTLLALAAKEPGRGARELHQIRCERAVLALALLIVVALRPEWALVAYLPAMFFALILVNVQNYYEHFGALPEDRFADSASHYGRVYNLLTFNDGYHQEHHLSPGSHWSAMEQVRRRHAEQLAAHARIISPLPAILGFLHTRRPRLDRTPAMRAVRRVTGDGQRSQRQAP